MLSRFVALSVSLILKVSLLQHIPNTNFVQDLVERDDQGYISRAEAHSSKTAVPGLFAAGDAADKVYRQAVTSAGSGAMAALDAERWLSEH